MKCSKCNEGVVRTTGMGTCSGLSVVCDKCGTFFHFREGDDLIEDEGLNSEFWKLAQEIEPDLDREEFLKRVVSQMITPEEFIKEEE